MAVLGCGMETEVPWVVAGGLCWNPAVLRGRLPPRCVAAGRPPAPPPLVQPPPSPQGLDRWQLAAAEQLAACCKSVLLGLAATAQELSVEQAMAAARAEEDHQIEAWGLVEGGHDIDIADIKVRVAAPSLFVRLLRRH